LLEALLAVVIFSVSITVIVHSLASSVRAVSEAARYQEALNVLENIVTDLKTSSRYPEAGGYKVDGREYTVEIESAALTAENKKDLNLVAVKIAWKTNQRNEQIVADIYAFKEQE